MTSKTTVSNDAASSGLNRSHTGMDTAGDPMDAPATGRMWAAVYREPGSLSLEKIPIPAIGRNELLVQIAACGLCGTDLKKIQYGLQPGPRVFGHEMAGTIVRVGDAVSGWAVGDRVALMHHVACGRCFYCDRGLDSQCAGYKLTATTAGFEPAGGGLAEYVRVTDRAIAGGVLRVPDGVRLEIATFIEPVNTCLKGVQRINGRPGDTVLTMGLGSIGMILSRLARMQGYRVIGVDPIRARCEAAARLAGIQTLDSQTPDMLTTIRSLTDGRGADSAIVATPAQAAIQGAISAVRPGGRVVLFANTRADETAEVNVGAICTADKEIVGSYSASMDLIQESCRLIFEGLLTVQDLISHRYPLSEIQEALAVASTPGPGVLKVLVLPGMRDEGCGTRDER